MLQHRMLQMTDHATTPIDETNEEEETTPNIAYCTKHPKRHRRQQRRAALRSH
jgi:hypothetical protein